MQEDENDEPKKKEPIEMTSDELLDYAIAPEVAECLRAGIREPEEEDDEPKS